MDPITIIGLLISSGVLTEIVKLISWALVKKPIPKNALPAISAAIGAGLAEASSQQVLGVPDMGIGPALGAAIGLAGTGGHQLLFANRYSKTPANKTA